MNATLANWLDYDIAQFAAGQLKLSDIVAADGAALLSVVSGRPGEVTTERFDVDLKRRQGQFLPVRLLHRVAFSSAGLPGASRTLVLNRAPSEDKGEDLRAAEVRFARFFNSTPMAIASVDLQGVVLRANGAFARLVPLALKASPGESRPSIYRGLAERDHAVLREAIAAAGEGKGDIAPVDVALEGEGARSARFFVSAADPQSDEGASAIVFALDTTEQRTLQENFVQSQKMQAIGQLAGGIAHDFNNVLTAIIGYSDLLLANHRPTDPSFQDIMQIKQNANRAAGLVRQLLAFSRRQTLAPADAAARRGAVGIADAAAPARRRNDRARRRARTRSVAGEGRPQSVRAGHRQSRRQRARRDERRRPTSRCARATSPRPIARRSTRSR